jgi:hypothetical protein
MIHVHRVDAVQFGGLGELRVAVLLAQVNASF